MFDDPELDAEICFKRDSENCCSDWATALEDVPASIGPAVPLSETSCMAGPDLAAT